MGVLARALARARGDALPSTASGPGALPPRSLLLASGLTRPELQACWLVASWLLTYPDDAVQARIEQLRALAGAVPATPGGHLRACLDRLTAHDPIALQEAYVDTFDTRRRGCLYLTYFSQGDTRRRGMALVRIKQDIRAAGVEVADEELPDHLAVVLEFAAAHDPERGAKILRANRPGLELLRLHLAEIDSPWHGAVAAVCGTLPPLDVDDREAVARLAAEGPEEELVGLDGYGAESLDGDAEVLRDQTIAGSGCGGHAAAPGPVPLDLMRGRPS